MDTKIIEHETLQKFVDTLHGMDRHSLIAVKLYSENREIVTCLITAIGCNALHCCKLKCHIEIDNVNEINPFTMMAVSQTANNFLKDVKSFLQLQSLIVAEGIDEWTTEHLTKFAEKEETTEPKIKVFWLKTPDGERHIHESHDTLMEEARLYLNEMDQFDVIKITVDHLTQAEIDAIPEL